MSSIRRLSVLIAVSALSMAAAAPGSAEEGPSPAPQTCEPACSVVDELEQPACDNDPSCGEVIMRGWETYLAVESVVCGQPCGSGTQAGALRRCFAAATVSLAAGEGAAVAVMACIAAAMAD